MQELIVNLNFLGLISIKGPDAQRLLQGQLTCDLTAITCENSSLAAHCNPKGRVISLGRLLYFQEQYLLLLPKELVPIALNSLKKYGVFFKVVLEDVTEYFEQIGFLGPSSALSAYPSKDNQVDAYKDHIIIKIPGQNARYLAIGAKNFTKTAHSTDTNKWMQEDFKAHIPSIYPETSGKFLPHELGLIDLNAVSFKKGCYTGQEIVARMEYRGKSKYHLLTTQVITNTIPQRGNDIFNNTTPIGSVLDFYQVGYNTYELLVVGPRDLDDGAVILLDRE